MVIEREKESGRGGSGFSILFLAFFLSVITAKRRKKGKSEREGKRESGAVRLIFFPSFSFFVFCTCIHGLSRAGAGGNSRPALALSHRPRIPCETIIHPSLSEGGNQEREESLSTPNCHRCC